MSGHERIWAKDSHDSWGSYGHWYRDAKGGGTEYVRADFHEVAINRQKSAAKLLLNSHREIIRNLQNKDRSEYNATATLQSERDANAILTEENAAQAARIAELEAALHKCEAEIDGYIWQEYPLDHPLHERYRDRDLSSNPARAVLSTPHSTMKETE